MTALETWETALLSSAYEHLLDSYREFFEPGPHEPDTVIHCPKLVIVLDEAHSLSEQRDSLKSEQVDEQQRNKLSAKDSEQRLNAEKTNSRKQPPVKILAGDLWRPSHVFCRAIRWISEVRPRAAIWVLFASTNSKVADFSAPSKLRASDLHQMGCYY